MEKNTRAPWEKVGESANDMTFRVVTNREWRRGIRLENIYWSCLEDLAKANNQRVGQYIYNFVKDLDTPQNVTSCIRVHVLDQILHQKRRLISIANGASTFNALSNCSTPYFAISERRELKSYNALFERYVRAAIAGDLKDSKTDSRGIMLDIRLTLTVPIDQLVRELEANNNSAIDGGFVISTELRRHGARAKICLIETYNEKYLVAFPLK